MKRPCHVGFVDDSSDDGIEIDVSAAVTSDGVDIAHHSFPVKRPRIQNTDGPAKPALTSSIPPITANTSEVFGASNDNTGEEKKRNQVWLLINQRHGI